jgi:protein TonB
MVTRRFLLALLASLLLHAAALWPKGGSSPRLSSALQPLAVHLPPLMPIEPLAKEAASPERLESAVAPAPSLRNAPALAASAPQPLQGRALRAALAKLAQEEFYPREAIAQGLEGRVVLLLTLDETGRIRQIEVASSSGHALLDEAARHAATRLTHLAGGRRQVLLPVEFRLE